MTKRELESEYDQALAIARILDIACVGQEVEFPNEGDNRITLHIPDVGSFTITVEKIPSTGPFWDEEEQSLGS